CPAGSSPSASPGRGDKPDAQRQSHRPRPQSTMAPPHAIHFDAAPEAADFLFGCMLGQGSYAKVYHAKMKKTKHEFAVKVMDQSFIRKENKAAFVLTERKVMSRLAHPFIVKFYCSFRDSQSLYMAMELCRGGDLFALIRDEAKKQREHGENNRACSFEVTQFYMAQLVVALEYLHTKKVVHRDLKPDNLLLSGEGHLKVTDFGTAKDEEDQSGEANQFCGTVSYVSPEVLNDKPATKSADLWALGCIIYQMFTGRPPFVAENDYLTFQVIMNHSSDKLEFPASVPESARDLIRKLLVQDVSMRLGAGDDLNGNGYSSLKTHPFFEGVDWDNLQHQEPPYKPPTLELPEPKQDGASEHWTVAEYFSDDAFSECTTDDLMSNIKRSRSSGSMRASKPGFLSFDEHVRFEAKVKVHAKMFKRTRQLVLSSTPRLLLISTWSGKSKREIVLTRDTRVNSIGAHTFDVVSVRGCFLTSQISKPSGTFRITDPQNNSATWARHISEAVEAGAGH
ncbi:TPA: hypothetical protein N0F65_012469, partial [Lagenidium giganteum]